ncbi:MAG: hypothetical protein DBX97_25080 [Collinsella tanakaei]|nr:MAG: hypothetical protein DBX97_25080 [Collinsella tanakaei]
MNLSWLLFYGRMLHMSKQEILRTDYAEMCDMISCLSIYNGAEPKKKKRPMRFEDAINLR